MQSASWPIEGNANTTSGRMCAVDSLLSNSSPEGEALLEIILDRLSEKSTQKPFEYLDDDNNENDSEPEAVHVAGNLADTLGSFEAVGTYDLEQVDIVEQHTLLDDIDTSVLSKFTLRLSRKNYKPNKLWWTQPYPFIIPEEEYGLEEDNVGIQPSASRSA